MSGNYPNAPSWRLAYDRDGTQGFLISSDLGSISQLATVSLQVLNDESSGALTGLPDGYLALIFPELRDLDGYFFRSGTTHPLASPVMGIQVSADTTNGVDGTWTSIRAVQAALTGNVVPDYRTGIVSNTSLGIRAVRFQFAGNSATFIPAIHLYGEPIPGANPNRLALWHPTLDQRLSPSHFDWGDVPRSSSADRLFRVKNLSSALTANSIRVAMDVLTDTTPSVPAQHTLQYGGGSFLAQVNVGSLAPGAISDVVTMRRITPSNATLGTWAHRVFAEANSWS